MSGPPPTWLPDGDDELLLRTALWPDARGAAAWAALRPRLDLDTMGHERAALLPLVHRTLLANGVDDPDLGRMKGLHRRHWYRNQRLLRHVAPVLTGLRDADIPTMALKGVPLGLTCYADLGLRPMADLDLLVPFDRFVDAVEVIDANGFTGRSPHRPQVRYFHSRLCRGPEDTQIDLHFVVHESLGLRGVPRGWWGDFWHAPVEHDEFWSRAEPLAVAGAPTLSPSATDLLLHVLVHGVGNESGARLRWITDAVTLLDRRGPEVDWALLVDQAHRRRVVLAIRDTLGYLQRSGLADVPSTTLADLRTAHVGRRERWVYAVQVDPVERPGRLIGVRWHARRFARATAHESLPAALAALPAYLAWDAERPRQVPLRIVRRAVGGVRKAATSPDGDTQRASSTP